ncbi:HypC/HybG/HupF family hydrogenase formation chaperone [candidate division KSB1 bacterium]|nr:HypC/HybG/HupF family hydrogenase formation chaperone [Phycisphaerae bacterium]NIP51079.1 HypC/HybG/HupF family hydrogenase formation chaperone [Phycisphaerae bacterium]NIV92133.1 HypC/HybG/HupF family hydrogenase formation chaperone [candidate division KSB1 bacterium]NIX31941.1 HypC/HybG/HupF family hydrogenase formation chaperone [Phycisphaerae bacterium]
MCLAVPGKVIAIDGDTPLTRTGKVAFSGLIKETSMALLPGVAVGDYVLVHAGFAITVLNEAEAHRSLDYLEGLTDLTSNLEPES